MSYSALRTAETMRLLEHTVQSFVSAFDPGAPTIFFLPGGMASALLQATVSVDAAPPPYDYETIWVGPPLFCGQAGDLRMEGVEDANRHMTIPADVIGFAGIKPYDNFKRWCQQRTVPFNYFLVSWDWRLPLRNSVDFFMISLLPRIVYLLEARGVSFYATEYYLIGHSFGGQLVKSIISQPSKFVTGLRRAITVASPFYGYGTSEHFYFSGFKDLNLFYTRNYLSQLIATFTGPYVLLFPGLGEFAVVGAALQEDPEYPLLSYPSVDAVNAATAVDPYKLAPDRYPPWVLKTAMKDGAAARGALTKKLPSAVNSKLHHIRGVTTENGRPKSETIINQQWLKIAEQYDPDKCNDPITNAVLGPGDGVVPAWSARLVTTPACNVHTVESEDIDHLTMMDDLEVLDGVLAPLIGGAALSLPLVSSVLSRTMGVMGPSASEGEAREFLQSLSSAPVTARRVEILRGTDPERLKAIVRRLLRDLLKPERPASHPAAPERPPQPQEKRPGPP